MRHERTGDWLCTVRAVAIASGAQMTAALRSLGYEVAVVDTARGLIAADEEPSFLRVDPGAAPPPLEELRGLERGMLLGGLGEIPVIREADVLCLALHGGQGEDRAGEVGAACPGVPVLR